MDKDTPHEALNLSVRDQTFETKLDISVIDNKVVVTLGEGTTMDDAAELFFDQLHTVLPHWIANAGYIPKPKD